MPQVLGPGVRVPIAEREIPHPPRDRPSGPAQVRPGGGGFGGSAGKCARRSTAVHVAIAITGHPGEGFAARAAHQQLRPGRRRGRADRPPFPDVADGFELLAKTPAASAAVDAGHRVIFAAGADCEPKGDAAVGECVDRGGLLCQDGRIAQGGDHDHGGQPHPLGHRRGGGQRRKGLVILVGDAVHHSQAAEGTGVRALRPVHQELPADTRRGGRQADPDVHLSVAPSEEMISFCG